MAMSLGVDSIEEMAAELGSLMKAKPPTSFKEAIQLLGTALDLRHAKEPHTTWHMSDEELAQWAAIISVPTPGECDGSEPIDEPPAGFATWDDWRRHRWPPSVS